MSPDKTVDILRPTGVFFGIREDPNLTAPTASTDETVPGIEIIPSPAQTTEADEGRRKVKLNWSMSSLNLINLTKTLSSRSLGHSFSTVVQH